MSASRNRTTLTPEIARAAGLDAGNRSMRAAGRTTWSVEDYNAAAAETGRLFDRIWPTSSYPGAPEADDQDATIDAIDAARLVEWDDDAGFWWAYPDSLDEPAGPFETEAARFADKLDRFATSPDGDL